MFAKYFNTLYSNWKEALNSKEFVVKLCITLTFYLIFFKVFRLAAEIMELRQGTQLHDFILELIPAKDFSTFTFSLTYFALVFYLIHVIPTPRRFVIGLQAYTLLLIFRMTTIYLVPLEPPIGMIVLIDPVSNFFMQSSSPSGYIVKDLFFSGHISAISLFYMVSAQKWVKQTLLFVAIIVASLILVQHVHYVVDVIAAPFFSFLALRMTLALEQKRVRFWNLSSQKQKV